jgi:ATP-dependent protease ClpP protease subunit
MRHWFKFQNVVEANAELLIYDDIGDSIDGKDSVTAKAFVEQLQALPATVRAILVRINSLGGDVFAAISIFNALRDQAAKGRRIDTVVDGIAAGPASLVLMAGDSVRMPGNALMMIDEPQAFVCGNAREMRAMADNLATIRDGGMVPIYQRHSKLSADQLRALMSAVTYMTADEAIAKGFATEKIADQAPPEAASARAYQQLRVPAAYHDRVAALCRPYREHVAALAATHNGTARPAARAIPRLCSPAQRNDEVLAIVDVCTEFGRLDLMDRFVSEHTPIEQVTAALTLARREREASILNERSIRAVCTWCGWAELADGYIAAGMSFETVRTQLLILSTRADGGEIDSSLSPNAHFSKSPSNKEN